MLTLAAIAPSLPTRAGIVDVPMGSAQGCNGFRTGNVAARAAAAASLERSDV